MLQRLTAVLGLVVLLGIAVVLSRNRRRIQIRTVFWGLGLQVAFALLILAEIGDIERFPSPRHLVSYAGLTTSVHSSGGKTR